MKKNSFCILLIICILSLILTSCSESPSKQDYDALKTELDRCNAQYKALEASSPPIIEKFTPLNQAGNAIEPQNGWYNLLNKTTVRVQLKGAATKVDIYAAPTGTDSYMLQQLAATSYVENSVTDLTLSLPESFIGRIWVVAYNGDVARKSKDINIILTEH